MQPTEVRCRVVEKRCVGIEVDADQAANASVECGLRGYGLGSNSEDEGGLEVKGVDLRVGGVEV